MPAAAPKIVNRAADPKPAAARPPVQAVSPPGQAQCAGAMKVSSPHDPAEKEAESNAKRVMRMADSGAGTPQFSSGPMIARSGEGVPKVSSDLASQIQSSHGSGSPLPPSVRKFMEPRMSADFANVKVHSDEKAGNMSRQLNARAFTVGNQIFFGKGRFQPDSHEGRELIAHELTHTIQQGAAKQSAGVKRSIDAPVSERTAPQVHRGWLPDPFEFIANKASSIPGFTMLTVVIGFNPITGSAVDRSAGNILRGAIELIPGGSYITTALNNHGIFDRVSNWALTQFNAIKNIGNNLLNDIKQFIKGLGISDLGNLGGVWDRGKALVTGIINQVIAFAIGLKDGFVKLIKDLILKPIGAFAQSTSGYKVLCSVMGRDPITGESAPQDPEALMGAFMTFIGQQETWSLMQQTKAIPRTFAWFKTNIAELKAFVMEIPGLFLTALKSLDIMDIILIPLAFAKLGKVFGSFAGRFISWGAKAVWDLLEIIFDVVKPGVMGYVKRTGGALKGILKNPMPFVGNLVKAGMLGFKQFAANFGAHLKAGLIDWLTGSLPGVYIPSSFALKEIVKFALSVLGLTWANIRAKLVKATSETVVKGLETAFDIVVKLVREGPAAAWEKIKEQLGNLKDMVIGGITDFVIDMVVKKAIPKIIAMFIPGAGFISAILSIYDTVMVFVQKLSKIAAVVGAFVDSIVQIAAGNIAGAGKKVEGILAGLLSLAISFLAGFAGLGKVADKVMGVIRKIRAPIDKALDFAINWIVTTAKKLFAKLFGKGDSPEEKQKRLDQGAAAAVAAVAKYSGKKVKSLLLKPLLMLIKLRYRMTSLEPIQQGDKWAIRAEVNPIAIRVTNALVGPNATILDLTYEPEWPLDEFMSKAKAIKAAAEGKPAKDAAPAIARTAKTQPPKAGKPNEKESTRSKRQGEQKRFRNRIHAAIKKIDHDADRASAVGLMGNLQADHQQDLQIGGTDSPGNMAMIQSKMNGDMGWQLDKALKDVAPDTMIDVVNIHASGGGGGAAAGAPPATPNPSGPAKSLRIILSRHAGKIGLDAETINSWFKLE
jgi:hypothetical protein